MHCRQGHRPLQTSGARTDGTASGHHPGPDDPGAGPIPAGLGRLFRLQPVARVGFTRRLDQTATAMRRLGPVEDARQAIPGTSPPQGLRTAGQCGYLQPEGTLAAERRGSSAPRLHQSSLRPSGPPLHGKAGKRLIRRTAVLNRLDVWSMAERARADPASFGFVEIAKPCNTSGRCEGYLFWDQVHPTTQAHQRLAEAALQAVAWP